MKTIKQFIAMILCISLCMSLTQAQPAMDKRQEAQASNTIAQDVLIIIQQEKVRFAAQKTVEEMRLQIFDQAGQLVYDSGAEQVTLLDAVTYDNHRLIRRLTTRTIAESVGEWTRRDAASGLDTTIGSDDRLSQRILRRSDSSPYIYQPE